MAKSSKAKSSSANVRTDSQSEAGPKLLDVGLPASSSHDSEDVHSLSGSEDSNSEEEVEDEDELGEGMDADGFAGPSTKGVQPLTKEELASFNAAQENTGVVYISRIPPGMRPTKVRHLMSGYGEVGRVYLQQEDAKRAYLRKKYTATKKAHYTEGWVEFKNKKVARSVAEMLNAQPIGGKKGTRWRDDVWTMKYLPKFKWNMLTEQIAHESAVHAARLRVELSQSKREQQEYLKNVELARVLGKRAERKRLAGKEDDAESAPRKKLKAGSEIPERPATNSRKREIPPDVHRTEQLGNVLSSIF